MLEIKDEEALVVLLDALKTNTLATDITSIRTVQLGFVVDAEDGITTIVADVALFLGAVTGDIPSKSAIVMRGAIVTYLTKPLVFSSVTKLKLSKKEDPE